MQKDDQREGMSIASKDMPEHTGGEDKSQMRNEDQSCPTKGGTVRESETKPSDPQLVCFIPQCRHWRRIGVVCPELGRCTLKHAFIRQKTRTMCNDGNVRYTEQWPEFVCQGYEWHDRYAEEDVTWVAVAELPGWPVGPDLAPDTDLKAVDRLIGKFRLTRGAPMEDPTDETTEEVSEVIPKEEPASNVIEFPADLSRR